MDPVACIEFCEDDGPAALGRCVDRVCRAGARSLLILACEADRWTPEALDELLKAVSAPLFGGIFPGIIWQDRQYHHGTLVVGLSGVAEVSIVRGLSAGDEDMDTRVQRQCRLADRERDLIVLVDGLSSRVEPFVDSLYRLAGPGRRVVGGGAGSLDFVQRPCLFSNEGLLADAALVVAFPFPVHCGVRHGWEILDGPYLVTGACHNVLDTLNYRPAFDLYRDCIEGKQGPLFDGADFFDVAKTFPLGIESLDGDILVRDPIRAEDRSLVCVGEVPENAMVYVLRGQADRLIEAASRAAGDARRAHRSATTATAAGMLVFDCISRTLFLGDAFDSELDAIVAHADAGCPVFGTLSLGEITNTASGPIDLLNKSTVISVF